MKSFLNVAAVVCGLLAVGVYFSAWLSERRTRGRGGFQEWVKNPEWKKAATERFAARKALRVSDDISDAEIQRMVGRLFVKEDGDLNFDRLKLVGPKAIPFLIQAIDDPRNEKSKFDKGEMADLDSSALERICDLLEPFGPPEAAAHLLRFVDHADSYFRGLAAIALGNIGTVECIEPILKLLADPEGSVWSSAMIGIQMGCNGQRCRPEFCDAVFPAVANRLVDDDGSLYDVAPGVLLAIDRERAMSILLSEKFFSASNGQLNDVLRSLNEAGCRIPHTSLLPLLKQLQPLSNEYPHSSEYSEALIAYAHNPDAAAEELLRMELLAADKRVQLAAAKALAICAGIPDATSVVLDKKRHLGFDALSEPQQLYYATFGYAAEVVNGGHTQYFVNSSGAQWKTVLRALTAVRAAEIEKILQEAVAVFGPDEPSVDDDTRHRQLASFSKRQNEALQSLDNRYYECRENLEGLLLLFAIEHKEHFSAPSKP